MLLDPIEMQLNKGQPYIYVFAVTLQVTDNTHVCSAHFKDEDFKRTLTGMRKLKPGVIPSQFQWTAVTSRKPPKVRKIAEPTPTPSASKERYETVFLLLTPFCA